MTGIGMWWIKHVVCHYLNERSEEQFRSDY